MRILLFSILICLSMEGISQFSVTQNEGSSNTLNVIKAAMRPDSGLIIANLTDTSKAVKIKYYAGAVIRTGDQFWYRDSTATRWLPLNGGVDSTEFEPVIDSTGNISYKVLFALAGRIVGDSTFTFDTTRKTLVVKNIEVEDGTFSQLFLVNPGEVNGYNYQTDDQKFLLWNPNTYALEYAENPVFSGGTSTDNLDSVVSRGNWTDDSVNIRTASTIPLVSLNRVEGGPFNFGKITIANTFNADMMEIVSDEIAFTNTLGTRQKIVQQNTAAINNAEVSMPDTSGNIAVGVKANGTIYMAGTNGIADLGTIGGAGTVTSIATNNGTGITGGTITTSGTLANDTTILATRAWRDKLADSLGALIDLKPDDADVILNQDAYQTDKRFSIRSARLDSLYGRTATGLVITNNSGAAAIRVGSGGGTTVGFDGSVNIDGTTRLATSLTGYLKATSGTVSAVDLNTELWKVGGNDLTAVSGSDAILGANNLASGSNLLIQRNGVTRIEINSISPFVKFQNGAIMATVFGNNSIVTLSANAGSGQNAIILRSTTALNSTTTDLYHTLIEGTISPASGSFTKRVFHVNPTFNSAATGDFIGIDYNPTVTAIGGNHYGLLVRSGKVGIGTASPAASSILDATSTTGGVLIPRLNTTQQTAISSPATGLLIYNTDSTAVGGVMHYTGSAWAKVGGSGGGSMIYPGAGVAVSTGSAWTTSISNSTIGTNILSSTNPSAVTFLRGNADNSVTWRSASDYRTDIGVAAAPVWVDYSGTSTVVGWSSFTTKNIRYSISGKQMTVNYYIEGTSDATSITFTLPFAIGASGVTPLQGITYAQNNGSAAIAQFSLSGSTVTLNRFNAIGGTTTWTNSGTKRAAGTFTYEID